VDNGSLVEQIDIMKFSAKFVRREAVANLSSISPRGPLISLSSAHQTCPFSMGADSLARSSCETFLTTTPAFIVLIERPAADAKTEALLLISGQQCQ